MIAIGPGKRWGMITIILMLILNFVSHAQTAVDAYGQLGVSGRHVVDQHGNPVQLQGMSLFWSNWSPSGDGGNYWTYGAIRETRDNWCANIVRAAMGVERPGGYLSHPNTQKQKVKDVIEWAIQLGMYVVVDWHSYEAHLYQQDAIDFFTEIAQEYGHHPNIIYEVYNEPLQNVSWPNTIKPYCEAVIAAIRQHDTNNIIVCGTPDWSQRVDLAANDPITGHSNIAYVLHYYAGSHGQQIRNYANQALNQNICLFVTEYGVVNADGRGNVNAASANEWYNWMNANQISHCNWSLHDKEDDGETASALRRNTSAQGGWADSDLTASGLFVKNHLTSNCPDYGDVPSHSFALHPQTQVTDPGDAVTFTAEATGDQTITYQWHFNGNPISGATSSSYSIANVTIAHAGQYYVTATMNGVTISSRVASLIVDDPEAVASGYICGSAGAMGVFDDFTGADYTESTDGSPARGLYWWGDANTQLIRNTSAGELEITMSRAQNEYEPFGVSFGDDAGDGSGTPFTVDFTEDFSYDIEITNKSDYELVFAVRPEDANGNLIDSDADAGNYIGGNGRVPNPWRFAIQVTVPANMTRTLTVGTNNGTITLDGTYLGGYHLYENPHCDNLEGCTVQEFDYSRVTGLQFMVTNAANTGDPDYHPLALDNASFAITSMRFGTECEPEETPLPEIEVQPVSQSVALGDEVEFSVEASGEGTITYQWYFGGVPISDAEDASYTIASAGMANAGNYYVVVRMGGQSVQSNAVTLTVVDPDAASSGYICENNGVAAEVFDDFTGPDYDESVDGEPARGIYWWADDKTTLNRNISAGELNVTMSRDINEYEPFGFSFGDDNGDETGNLYTVDFSEDFSYEVHFRNDSDYDLNIAVRPEDVNGNLIDSDAIAGDHVGGTGVVNDPWRYAIKIVVPRGGVGVLTLDSPNGENTPEGIDVHLNGTFIGGYHLYENPNCAEGVEGCTVQDFDYSKVVGVQFMVTNRDNGGAAPWHPQALDNANLAITSMRFGGDCDRDASLPDPVIDVQPISQSVDEGDEAIFTVVASGDGDITYQWYRNDQPIPSAESASYTIPSASMADAGDYYVIVTMNGQTVTSDEVTLTVTPLPAATIDVQPVSQTAVEGDEVTLSVTASGEGTITYQWYRNGEPIPSAESANYTIPSASMADAGEYYVVVTMNGQTVTSDEVTLTVTPPPAASIDVQPIGQTAIVGDEVVFSVQASGDGAITYQWYFNGSPISNADGASLTIPSAQLSDAGSYYVVVTMNGQDVQSNTVGLTVNETPPATITVQPVGQSVVVGEELVISVEATGDGNITYQWYHDGTAIPNADGASLVIPSADASDAGSYYVVVTMDGATVQSDEVNVTVNPTPPATIEVQPVSQTAILGEDVIFSVEATGDGNITYQWYHNGTAIPNAENASLTISSAGATDEGSYYVVVTMDGAVVQSDAVILIVNDPPTATIDAQPSNQTATEGEEVVLSVDATVEGDGDVTYVWYHNGAAIDGENGSSYVIPSTSADHQGNYYVEVLVDGVVVAVTDPFTLDVNPTSVFNRADGANYTLYPNPVMSGDVLIFSNMINNVTVYDAKGNVVERAANMDLLNTGNYTPGIYVILSDEGARRFIVK